MPGLSGEDPRMISWVKRARRWVASGRNPNRCQICGNSWPAARMALIASRYPLGWFAFSTSGRNIGGIGSILSLVVMGWRLRALAHDALQDRVGCELQEQRHRA